MDFNTYKKKQRKKRKPTKHLLYGFPKYVKLVKGERRIPGVRFAPEVPEKICRSCKLASKGHPLLLSTQDPYGYDSCYNKLCTRDALKKKVPLIKGEYDFDLKDKPYYSKY